jgi:methylated-DNA-protein-cysteine methyltransferase-like protein
MDGAALCEAVAVKQPSDRVPLYSRIYAVIRRIPKGRVSTYGRIAELVGCGARQVGYAMAALPDATAVPWHRVINARGGISIPGGTGITQRLRLESEGVRFSQRGTVDLSARGWPRAGSRGATPSKRLSRPDRSRTG